MSSPVDKHLDLELEEEPLQRFDCLPLQMKKNLLSYINTLIVTKSQGKELTLDKGKMAVNYKIKAENIDTNELLAMFPTETPEEEELIKGTLEQLTSKEGLNVYTDSPDSTRDLIKELKQTEELKVKPLFINNKENKSETIKLTPQVREELANFKFAVEQLIPTCTNAGRVSNKWLKKQGATKKDLIIIGSFKQLANCKNLDPISKELLSGIEQPDLKKIIEEKTKRLIESIQKEQTQKISKKKDKKVKN